MLTEANVAAAALSQLCSRSTLSIQGDCHQHANLDDLASMPEPMFDIDELLPICEDNQSKNDESCNATQSSQLMRTPKSDLKRGVHIINKKMRYDDSMDGNQLIMIIDDPFAALLEPMFDVDEILTICKDYQPKNDEDRAGEDAIDCSVGSVDFAHNTLMEEEIAVALEPTFDIDGTISEEYRSENIEDGTDEDTLNSSAEKADWDFLHKTWIQKCYCCNVTIPT